MATLMQNKARGSADAKKYVKKRSTQIDMTPMVDLAFLLLTFFILTTTFHKANVMHLSMPEKVKDTASLAPMNDENMLNLVLAENHRIYWWMGLEPSAKATDYSSGGIRKILLEQRTVNPALMVLIKPMDNAKYENVVDILDEMEITMMQRYMVVDCTADDKARISVDR